MANERCGSWYAYPLIKDGSPYSCYFKSTDGHVGTWNFSLKRLNLNILRLVSQHGGCVILDASASKEVPDSLSRTIPIWASVLNRIAGRYRRELGLLPATMDKETMESWACDWGHLSTEEQSQIEKIVDYRVDSLHQSQAIVDPLWLASTLVKPLQCFWISPQNVDLACATSSDCFSIVCLSCSDIRCTNAATTTADFIYSPGAADDAESWARHLNPQMFWDNGEVIFDEANSTEDLVDLAIDSIVQDQKSPCENDFMSLHENLFDRIGTTSMYIGSRRAGRLPECWENFDAILNVTDMEYPEFSDEKIRRTDKFYLQLPVREGKRDKFQLERWLAVGTIFVFIHANRNRGKVLIHCAQGKGRSVAVVMAVVSIFCELTFPLSWNSKFWNLNLGCLVTEIENDSYCKWSGLPQSLVQDLLGPEGRNHLFRLVYKDDVDHQCDDYLHVSKHALRVALLLVQQDREKADPSRSTMQKLNRFFMSNI